MTLGTSTAEIMERRRIVAEAIRAGNLMKFDIRSWGVKNDCGTYGCIAGHAVAVFDPEFWRRYLSSEYPGLIRGTIKDKAAEILGLSEAEALGLFVGSGNVADEIWPYRGGWDLATPDEAADAILRIAAPA